jgi:hypothetical protein
VYIGCPDTILGCLHDAAKSLLTGLECLLTSLEYLLTSIELRRVHGDSDETYLDTRRSNTST